MTKAKTANDWDRIVHGVTADGAEIVRYDRAGKWYVEWEDHRTLVTIRVAVEFATAPGSTVYRNQYGGAQFNNALRKLEATR